MPPTSRRRLRARVTTAPRRNRSAPVDVADVPLTFADWIERDLPKPDYLLGSWLTTTSRVLLSAPTGLGKTNFLMALFAHVAAGKDFLRWRGIRPARVLDVDGEMSRQLLKTRAIDVARRLGCNPEGFHLLSHEDVEGFAPLNTPEGARSSSTSSSASADWI